MILTEWYCISWRMTFLKLLSNSLNWTCLDSDTCPELDWLLDFKLSHCQIYLTYSPLTAWLTVWLPPSHFRMEDLNWRPALSTQIEFCLIHQSDEFIPTLTLTVHWFNWNWCALSLIYLKLTTAVHRLSHENDTWIEGVALTWSPVPHVTVTTLVHLIFTILIHLTESLTQSVTGKNSQYSPHGIAFPQIRKLLIIELSASLVFFCIFPNCHCEPD